MGILGRCQRRLMLSAGASMLAVASLPGTAAASPISLSATFAGSFCSGSTSGSGSLSLDVPCSSTDTGGLYAGEALAQASYVGSLRLGAEATATVLTSTFEWGTTSEAEINDTVTLLGEPVGTRGFLQLTFTVDGSISCGTPGDVVNTFGAGCTANFGANLESDAFLKVNGLGGNVVSSPDAFALDVPLTFGVASPIQLSLTASTGIACGAEFGCSATPAGRVNTADFYDTATLTGTEVLNVNQQVVPGGSVLSADGLPLEATPVPEPASIVTLATGVLGFLRLRCRRIRPGSRSDLLPRPSI